jgi:hypothetical protein
MAATDDTQTMLRTIINNISSFKQDMLKRFDDMDRKFENKIDNLDKKIDGVEARLTKRIDNLGNHWHI